MTRSACALLVAGLAVAAPVAPTAAQETEASVPVDTPEQLVAELYDLVTFDAGTTPDWDRVRSLFLEEAVIVMRTSQTETGVFSVDAWVDDFVRFIERANVEATGFTERIVRTRTWTFRDMAHVLVLYEASIPGWGRPPMQGVDSFSLVRLDGRWWVAAITNDLPDADHPVPEELSTRD